MIKETRQSVVSELMLYTAVIISFLTAALSIYSIADKFLMAILAGLPGVIILFVIKINIAGKSK